MKKLIATLLFLILAVPVFAEPFLVCDPPNPDEQVSNYGIYKDGVLLVTVPKDSTGKHGFIYDLKDVTPGKYVWTATAKNVWGESEQSHPFVSPSKSSSPGNLNVTVKP